MQYRQICFLKQNGNHCQAEIKFPAVELNMGRFTNFYWSLLFWTFTLLAQHSNAKHTHTLQSFSFTVSNQHTRTLTQTRKKKKTSLEAYWARECVCFTGHWNPRRNGSMQDNLGFCWCQCYQCLVRYMQSESELSRGAQLELLKKKSRLRVLCPNLHSFLFFLYNCNIFCIAVHSSHNWDVHEYKLNTTLNT